MRWRKVFVLWAALTMGAAFAREALPLPELRPGECVIFREGGGGYVLTTPTFWLKGRVAGIETQRRWAGRCPVIGKAPAAYSRSDWATVVEALSCVASDSEVGEVSVVRVQVVVESWDTPWSNQHGAAGWLFRGMFVDKPLKKGDSIDMDAAWLERCDS
ncbi:MAG: hypothetical protein WCK63_09380 [Betaproteobacteria bacterium]